ncbi:hypothetical protein M514_04904, partial [Trichuris suis]|uniref:glucuronosyltransferase n=1 Tax=Trichuris suis TaxID=68888 RepID=A0A085MA81_9BILA
MKATLVALVIVVIFQGNFSASKGARIVLLPAMGAKSHVLSMLPLALALQQDGHNVTVLQYYNEELQKVSRDNLHFIYVRETGIDIDSIVKELQAWTQPGMSMWAIVKAILSSASSCQQTLHNPKYASLYSTLMSGYWDLLIVDNVFHPCGVYVTSCAKNLSWIDYSTTLMFRRTRTIRAVNLPISTEPNMNMINYEPKSFKSRLTNTVGEMAETALGTLLRELLPYWTEGKLTVSMNVRDFHRRAIYSFGSMSPMLDFALPQAANAFIIAYSCPKPAALSNDFLELVDDPSSKGTIIVSFGHYVKWKYATTEILQSISNVFNNMTDYRIIWQYDGDRKQVANKAHIKLAAWLPLPALLKHPKTVLFINHVGIKSLHEAVCFAVPLVAIPMFGDQYRNAALIRQRHLGIFLEKTRVNELTFRSAIEAILKQPAYKKNMKAMSAMTKDKIVDDLTKGKFWIDFYLRHPKAAAHMKLKGVDFCNFIYFDIDLIVVLSALFFLLVEVLQKC